MRYQICLRQISRSDRDMTEGEHKDNACKQNYDRGPLGTLSLHDKHHVLLGRLANARILPVHHKHSVPTPGVGSSARRITGFLYPFL